MFAKRIIKVRCKHMLVTLSEVVLTILQGLKPRRRRGRAGMRWKRKVWSKKSSRRAGPDVVRPLRGGLRAYLLAVLLHRLPLPPSPFHH
jgi:hypothetical protein